MRAYHMNEASFDLPDGNFVDRTVTYLEGTAPGGADVVLYVERQPFPAGRSLRELANNHVQDAKKRLRGYTIMGQRELEVLGLPALDLGVRWRSNKDELVYTRQVHLVLDSTWLIVAGEAPVADREFCDACVDRVLSTLRLRG